MRTEETASYNHDRWKVEVIRNRDVFVPRPKSASAFLDLRLGLDPEEFPKVLDPVFESRIQAQV
jgi:hypothetical protein